MSGLSQRDRDRKDAILDIFDDLLFDDERAGSPPPAPPPSPSNEAVKDEGDSPELLHNAPMWSLHLNEANDQAKAQADLWKTGLESLLLFAGLFAGVVSAFVLESRKKLRQEDQEFLLQSIYNHMRGEQPPSRDQQPMANQLWINGLWFASLLTTLFSAILGVLAKSWLVKYSPIVTRQNSSDEVYRRWRIEEEAKRWHLERVFTGIPILVQLAFFLFTAGLTIQCLNDNVTVGRVVFVLVAVAVAIYLFLSALPLFTADGTCPFQTPLSEFLVQLRKHIGRIYPVFIRISPLPQISEDIKRHALVQVWCEKLIQSSKLEYVDAGVAEVTRHTADGRLLEALANSGITHISLKRLKRLMSSDIRHDATQNEVMSRHLSSLAALVKCWVNYQGSCPALESDFHDAITQGNPLGDWNYFSVPVRPLAFTVRVPILLKFRQDVSDREMAEQPWGQLARNLRPKNRFQFLLVCCRAILGGKYNLRKMSSLCVTSSMGLALEANSKSDWSGASDFDQKDALKRARLCIICLCNETLHSLKDAAEDYWDGYSSTGILSDPDQVVQASWFPYTLSRAFSHQKPKYRKQAISIALSLAESNANVSIHHKSVINLAVSDEDVGVRNAAIEALGFLCTKDTSFMKRLLRKDLVDAAKRSATNQGYVIELLTVLINRGLPDELHDADAVQLAVFIFSRPDPISHQSLSHLLMTILSSNLQQGFNSLICETFWESLDSDSQGLVDHTSALVIANRIRAHSSSHVEPFEEQWVRIIMLSMTDRFTASHLSRAMSDPTPSVRQAGQTLLDLFLSRAPVQSETHAIWSPLRQSIITVLYANNPVVCLETLEFLHRHSGQAQIRGIVASILSSLLTLNEHLNFKETAISLVQELVAHGEHANVVAAVGVFHASLEKFLALDTRLQECFVSSAARVISEQGNHSLQTLEDPAPLQHLNRLLDIAIHGRHRDIGESGIAAILSLCGSNGDFVLDILEKRVLSMDISRRRMVELWCGSTPDSPELRIFSKARQYAIFLAVLMKYDLLRNRAFLILQSRLGLFPSDNPNLNPRRETQEMRMAAYNDYVCSVISRVFGTPELGEDMRAAAMDRLALVLHVPGGLSALTRFQVVFSEMVSSQNPAMRRIALEVLKALPSNFDLSQLFRFGVMTRAQTPSPQLGARRLVDMAFRDEDNKVRETSLEVLTGLILQQRYSYELSAILRAEIVNKNGRIIPTLATVRERRAWVSALSALSSEAKELDIVCRCLINLAGGDDDPDVRKAAYKALNACRGLTAAQVAADIAKGFEVILAAENLNDSRCCLVLTLLRTDYLENHVDFKYGLVLQLLAKSLLRIALDEGSPTTGTRKMAQEFLRAFLGYCSSSDRNEVPNTETSGQHASDAEMHLAVATVLDELISCFSSLSSKTHNVAIQLVESVHPLLPEETSISVVEAAFKLLRSVPAMRMIALDVIMVLYKKGLGQQVVQSSIADVLDIAVTGRNVEERQMALKLLIEACSDDALSPEVKNAHSQLVPLLVKRTLRPAVVELVSLLCRDGAVRDSVTCWMISRVALGSEPEVEGTLALLCGLLVEKRASFKSNTFDMAWILLPSLTLSPGAEALRSRAMALLWCNYGQNGLLTVHKDSRAPEELVQSLVAAVFGQHVSDHELKAWKELMF